MILLAAAALVLAGVAVGCWGSTPAPLMGVYSRPGPMFWLKAAAFYVLVKLRRYLSKGKAGTGYGVKSRSDTSKMECLQTLSNHTKAIDAVYFNSASADGQYLVMAAARRPQGVVNGLLYIRIPKLGLLKLPKMPDTLLFGNGEEFGAEGLLMTPQEPMKTWRLQYNGPMRLEGTQTSHVVSLDAEWSSHQPYFDFDTDMHLGALARSMAREPWSREYFRNLKEAHQTHYEQMGTIQGHVKVDDQVFPLQLDSMRDHSYGYKREWRLMHRYALHMFTTEDGLQANVGVICQPITCSQLELGYLVKGGVKVPVSRVDMPLWQYGEAGTPPTDYAFTFVAGGQKYLVEVMIVESPKFYIGWEWETRVVEIMATFKVNGRQGWGLAEWDYRHLGGRPENYASNDPAWTKDLIKG